jgi:uncharacterized membrane protein
MVGETRLLSRLKSVWRNLTFTQRKLNAAFPPDRLHAIERVIGEGEKAHRAELRVVIEGSLSTRELIRRLTPRQRALQLFGDLRVWDTEENCGVLLYILLADRAIEVVADRGIDTFAGGQSWVQIVEHLTNDFVAARFCEGLQEVVNEINDLLAAHFPNRPEDPFRGNEITNKPLLIL